MNKLTVTLKQHTPLIHFQHDQEGATLRASEVKPKLDKYIVDRCFHNNFDECREYLIGYNPDKPNALQEKFNDSDKPYRALNYKMKIQCSEGKTEFMLSSYIKEDNVKNLKLKGITAISNTPFFAQEQQNSQIIRDEDCLRQWNNIEKKGILHNNEILLTITSINDLCIRILDEIQSFFMFYNFGTRQSKGFGCFSVNDIDLNNKSFSVKSEEKALADTFDFVYKKTKTGDLDEILSTINEDYRYIKSGKRKPYAKSKLMEFFHKDEIYWEKRFIKQRLKESPFPNENDKDYLLKDDYYNRDGNKTPEPVESYSSFKYVRALLGLAEQYEFLLENPAKKNGKLKVKIKSADGSVQRFQSPILFKVIGNNIYIVGKSKINENILNHRFNFLVNIDGDEAYEDEPLTETGIRVPAQFSLLDFMRYALSDRSLKYTKIK